MVHFRDHGLGQLKLMSIKLSAALCGHKLVAAHSLQLCSSAAKETHFLIE